jgi:hypothetical protein
MINGNMVFCGNQKKKTDTKNAIFSIEILIKPQNLYLMLSLCKTSNAVYTDYSKGFQGLCHKLGARDKQAVQNLISTLPGTKIEPNFSLIFY